MKKSVYAIFSLLLFTVAARPVSAQMDMLPEIFRDLPPELQQGLPDQMSLTEYQQLTKNIDFFTMFMSMFVPGYGFFEVDKPGAAWTIMAGRAAGYGLMGTAVIRTMVGNAGHCSSFRSESG